MATKPKDKLNLADEIAESMREIFEKEESEMLEEINKELLNESDDYKQDQKKRHVKLTAKMKELYERYQSDTNKAIERASELSDTDLSKLKKESLKAGKSVTVSALSYHLNAVARITRMAKTIPLKEAIFKQTQIGISKGLPITTKSGRSIGYKEYMEMAVRTTIQTEIGETQLKYGAKSGIVFYLCNSFNDCADDHKDFQGKVYYDENWKSFDLEEEVKSKISNFIQSKNLRSFQDVRDNKPYLTTRPNCRHKMTAISFEQATGDKNTLLKDLKLTRGKYKPDDYDITQKQRYIERNIRNYKARLEQNKMLANESQDEMFKLQARKDSFLVRKWQKEQRELIKANPQLERDYRKETRNKIVQDLGAKYQT